MAISDGELDRRLAELDDVLGTMAAADLEDPAQTEAFLARVEAMADSADDGDVPGDICQPDRQADL